MAEDVISDADLARCRSYWVFVGPVPVDMVAEATVAGCAIDTAEGARLAVTRLGAGHFHDRRLWRAIETAAAIGEGVSMFDRPELVAAATGLPEAFVVRLVDGREVFQDRSGWHARRVSAAAAARRQVLALVDELDRLGVDLAALTGHRAEVHA